MDADRCGDAVGPRWPVALPTNEACVDTLLTILKDFQPAGVVIVLVAAISMVSERLMPQVGPWASLLAIAGIAAFVGNRVVNMADRPAWLLPLAAVGAMSAVAAGTRLFRSVKAHAYNDQTIGYVFPTALSIGAMWLSIALINFQETHATLVQAITNR